jgi:hypothetical protein
MASSKCFLYSLLRNLKSVMDVGQPYPAFANFIRVFPKSQLVN